MILVAVIILYKVMTKFLIEEQRTNYIMRSDHLFDIYLHVYIGIFYKIFVFAQRKLFIGFKMLQF